MRNIKFSYQGYTEFIDWAFEDFKTFQRINILIEDIKRTPFKGLGKPEPLKGNFKGRWSRRITLEHRLIYEIDNENITIISCKGHY
ncbi:MAG TPA: Txe/YoeB family addiction module toxin [Ignavibacteria bacterium]|nr:Txe/YoeB family addiction module toxin [Ignavibacteria bacterium]